MNISFKLFAYCTMYCDMNRCDPSLFRLIGNYSVFIYTEIVVLSLISNGIWILQSDLDEHKTIGFDGVLAKLLRLASPVITR